MKITVAGAGTWGTALGRILALKNLDVCIWSRFQEELDLLKSTRKHPNLGDAVIPDSVSFTTEISTAATDADYLIMAVPSVYTRETIKDFAPYVDRKTILISAAKGIESTTLMTLSEVIGDEMNQAGKKNTVVALSGPTHAEEVARDLPTLIVCACEDTDAAVKVQQLFDGTCIRPYVNPDIKGVQICGALKNVEALAAAEDAGEYDLDRIAGFTGNLTAEVFVMQEDEWVDELRDIGFYLGKFIYLLDAYDDLEKDLKKGEYNPWTPSMKRRDFEALVENTLMMMMSESAKAFEKLPIVQDVDILRNIIYSGVWLKFEAAKKKREEMEEAGR